MAESVIDLGLNNHWSSFKNLNSVIINATINKSVDCIYDLENLLKQHKPDFFSLLKQLPKNSIHKDVVLKSAKDGIIVIQQNQKSKVVIPQQMVEEALLISELFNINELISLEFIVTATNQEARFPGLARGPIAILLYYDSRKSLLNSIKLLVQAKNGRSWSTKLNREIQKLIDSFVDDLKQDGIVSRCIKQLIDIDITSEHDMLQRNQALGVGKYKQRLLEIIKEVRQLYADIVFAYSAQTDLNNVEVKELLEFLMTKAEVESKGNLDKVSSTLLQAFFYTIDVSILQTCDENDPVVRSLPVVIHSNLIEEIRKELANKESVIKGLETVLNFVWAITTKTLSLYPINSINQEFDDEIVIDECIEKKVFDHFTNLVVNCKYLGNEEFFIRRVHVILSDFVGLMPLKVKELRDKGDEMGRIIGAYLAEGLQPPENLCRHFESLLNLIAEVYNHDHYGLADDIWKSTSEDKQVVLKFVNFHKFISSSIDAYLPQILHVPLLNLLTAFARVSPFNIYNILKSSINQNSQFSFDQIFNTFNNYYLAFKGQDPFSVGNITIQSNNSSLQRNITPVNLKSIEIEVLCSTIKLIQTIVENDRTCCISIAENQRYSCINTFTGLLLCPLPRKLKANILYLLAGLSRNVPSIAFNIWLKMDAIFPKPQLSVSNVSHMYQQRAWQNGISVEIEDIEPKYEQYSVTIAYLEHLNSLLKHLNYGTNPQVTMQLNLNFVIDLIFIKSNSRLYKDQNEKWIIQEKCLQIIHRILESSQEASIDNKSSKDLFILMSQILQENTLFRRIIEIIEDSVDHFLNENNSVKTDETKNEIVESCLLESMNVLNLIIEKESDFIDSMHNNVGYPVSQLLNLSTLFFQINHRTQKIDRLATLIRVLSIPNNAIQIETLKFLQNLVVSNQELSENILLQIKPFVQYHEDYFLHSFVECCESDDKILRIEALKFILKCLQRDIYSSSTYGFSYRLFGFDRTKKSLKVAGAPGQIFNCLHSIIGILESDSILFTDERHLCMEILYTLCKDFETCNTLLRFLRTSYDLMGSYLASLQKKISINKENWLLDENISEIAWFFRILAIEIKTTSESNLKSYCNSYTRMLLDENKLTNLIPDKIFTHTSPESPKWEFFDNDELWKTMTEFTDKEGNLINIKMLRSKLANEVKMVNLQIGVLQTNIIQTEIDKIINFATKLNNQNHVLNSKVTFLEGWRELVEIMVTVDCLNIDSNSKTLLLLDVIQKLLSQVNQPDAISTMITPISSVLLLCCSALRSCQPEAQLKTRLLSTANSIMNLLESLSLLWNKNKRARVNFYAALIHIYKILPATSNGIKLNFRLLEKICKDVLSGQELNKVLTMSVLIESNPSWIKDVANDGTLRLIMDSLKEDDKEIKANKFDVRCKSFYSFETKMALLMKISLDSRGSKILKHLGIVEVLSELECFDLYSFLIGQSDICYKMVVSILRLLLSVSCTDEEQDIQQVSQFVQAHSSTINDILNLKSPVKNEEEGITVLTLVTSLLSKLCYHTKKQVQTSFLNLIHNYHEKIKPNETKILINILTGYVEIVNANRLKPLFAPNWDYRKEFPNIDLPSLGVLVSIVEHNIEKCRQSTVEHKLIELCIYLLWHHLNLYVSALEYNDNQKESIQRLIYESNRVISDMLFSKVQSIMNNNTFLEVFIRRIKRIVILVK